MRSRNIFAALVFIAFGAVYGYLTSRLTERTLPNTPGPSFFPWVLTACLVLLAAVLLAQGLAGEGGRPGPPEGTARLLDRPRLGLIFFAAYLLVLPYAGFLLATPFFFGALMRVAGERRPLWIGAFSIAVPLFLYGLFQKLFLILLPAGTLLD